MAILEAKVSPSELVDGYGDLDALGPAGRVVVVQNYGAVLAARLEPRRP
jgi:hypothetical protein